MRTKIVIAISISCLLTLLSCAAYGPNLSSPAYFSASPENQDRIRRGKVGLGMSIPECRAAWPDNHFEFINAFQIGDHRYETWKTTADSRVNTYQQIWIYIEIKDGIINDISEVRKR